MPARGMQEPFCSICVLIGQKYFAKKYFVFLATNQYVDNQKDRKRFVN